MAKCRPLKSGTASPRDGGELHVVLVDNGGTIEGRTDDAGNELVFTIEVDAATGDIEVAFINDDERGLHTDYEKWLEGLAPHAPISQYRHNDTGEDNADAHMKRQIMGREEVIAVTSGKLDFGTWEQIFYGEFDGRRKKRVLVKIIGE